jgi:hypothetical protein
MASQSLSEKLIVGLDYVPELYYRLALVVGLSGTGKTPALREVGEQVGARCVRIGVCCGVSLQLYSNQRPLLNKAIQVVGGTDASRPIFPGHRPLLRTAKGRRYTGGRADHRRDLPRIS